MADLFGTLVKVSRKHLGTTEYPLRWGYESGQG
jgi:hypothetical protein